MSDDEDFCRAISQPGTSITMIAADWIATVTLAPGDKRFQICTQHPDHRGEHVSRDGQGHRLATWSRRKPERYWHREDCNGCAHHQQAQSRWS